LLPTGQAILGFCNQGFFHLGRHELPIAIVLTEMDEVTVSFPTAKYIQQQKKISVVALLLAFSMFCMMVMNCERASAASFGRPLVEDGPTKVKVAVYIIDIDDIDNANQSFEANIYIELRWRDPRLAHEHPYEVTMDLKEIWNPRLQFINQQKIWPTLPEMVDVYQDGEVMYQQRVWGTFSQPLELTDFPFDRQTLEIQLGAAGYGPAEVKLVPDPDSRTGVSSQVSLADWDILGWHAETAPFAPSVDEAPFAGYYLKVDTKRRYGYFIMKVIIPLVLIVMMSWVVFWVDPKDSGVQISVAVTAMLTLIAYRFAVGVDLPKVSYLSRLDYFILGSTLLVFASLIEVVFTSTYAKLGELDRAQAIDRWARVAFPVVFLAMSLWSLVFGIH
jgi:hypothetical protein